MTSPNIQTAIARIKDENGSRFDKFLDGATFTPSRFTEIIATDPSSEVDNDYQYSDRFLESDQMTYAALMYMLVLRELEYDVMSIDAADRHAFNIAAHLKVSVLLQKMGITVPVDGSEVVDPSLHFPGIDVAALDIEQLYHEVCEVVGEHMDIECDDQADEIS